ncbi:MAG: potassium channel family protein [Nanoarchaeota archaeon]
MIFKPSREQLKKTISLVLVWVLIAVAFGFLYYFLPGELINSGTGNPVTSIFDFIYFSFVTILTIGYGDISAVGFIRSLTAVEGLIGWILFGLIVYKVVSVKEDVILREVHKLSNDQYLSRIRNFLFISNTNLVRFIKEVQSKKIAKDAVIYELSVISTTLKSNIEDTTRFLLMNKDSVAGELEEEETLILINGVNLCIANFVNALIMLPKHPRDYVLYENIFRIVESTKKMYNYYNIHMKNQRIEDLKMLYTKLEDFGRTYQ